jgi:hypothetical protein
MGEVGWGKTHQRSETRGKLKKEKNMGTQVQLNTRIKQIKDHFEEIKTAL